LWLFLWRDKVQQLRLLLILIKKHFVLLQTKVHIALKVRCIGFLVNSSISDKIVTDLFKAYFDARKNKRSTINALAFEKHFEANIFELADEIMKNRYAIKPSICFIVNKPVKREIFAANFRDRVVHHFIYNCISPLFEKLFINDTYSCRVGKGTHYGIKRIDHFIRSCSQNYRKEAYILKLDIRGYFMAMDKTLLFDKINSGLMQQKGKIDFDLPVIIGLVKKTLFNDPRVNCIIKGKPGDWNNLPKTKSLFYANQNCGLPIGNLTSQLFGNIYMNNFDHFVKRDLQITCYGRYVDDFVLVHNNKEYLKSIIPRISDYLKSELKLTLHPDKIYLQDIKKGVKYLGAVIKPHRKYIANRSKGNFYGSITKHNKVVRDHKPSQEEKNEFLNSMNSYLGIMKHYRTFKHRKNIMRENISGWWWNYFSIDGYTRLVSRVRNVK
jgi:RNA-directed DNA polymerase